MMISCNTLVILERNADSLHSSSKYSTVHLRLFCMNGSVSERRLSCYDSWVRAMGKITRVTQCFRHELSYALYSIDYPETDGWLEMI